MSVIAVFPQESGDLVFVGFDSQVTTGLVEARMLGLKLRKRCQWQSPFYQFTILVSSRTLLVISAFLILVVFFNPKSSQQKLAVTLP